MAIDATNLVPVHLGIWQPVMTCHEIRGVSGLQVSDATGFRVAVEADVVVIGNHLTNVPLHAAYFKVTLHMAVQAHFLVRQPGRIRRLSTGFKEVCIVTGEATETLRHALKMHAFFELIFYFGKVFRDEAGIVFMAIHAV